MNPTIWSVRSKPKAATRSVISVSWRACSFLGLFLREYNRSDSGYSQLIQFIEEVPDPVVGDGADRFDCSNISSCFVDNFFVQNRPNEGIQ